MNHKELDLSVEKERIKRKENKSNIYVPRLCGEPVIQIKDDNNTRSREHKIDAAKSRLEHYRIMMKMKYIAKKLADETIKRDNVMF
jgi:hypothetical protein